MCITWWWLTCRVPYRKVLLLMFLLLLWNWDPKEVNLVNSYGKLNPISQFLHYYYFLILQVFIELCAVHALKNADVNTKEMLLQPALKRKKAECFPTFLRKSQDIVQKTAISNLFSWYLDSRDDCYCLRLTICLHGFLTVENNSLATSGHEF